MKREVYEALKGMLIGTSAGCVIGMLIVSQCGCVLDWSGTLVPDDDAVDETDVSDQVDEYLGADDAQQDDAGPDVEAPDDSSETEDSTLDSDGDSDGVDESTDSTMDTVGLRQLCTNDCWLFRHNGSCNDGGPGSEATMCAFGSDCDDCGPRYLYPDGDIVEDVVP